MSTTLRLLKLCLLCALGAPLLAHAAPLYSIATLGSIGSTTSSPAGMNNAGQVVGYSAPAGVNSAFVSGGGVMSNLHPAGASASAAWGINNAGVAIGQVTSGDIARATTFSGAGATDIGALGGAGTASFGYAINDSGQAAGVSFLSENAGAFHAFRYTAGAMLDLGTLGGANSFGRGINTAGSVVGYAEYDAGGAYHAFLYGASGMLDLGTLGGSYSDAYAINDSGVAAGLSSLADESTRATLFSGGAVIDLGTLGGDSAAYGINSAGQAVGTYATIDDVSFGQHAFLYAGGTMIDLNTLIDPASGWTLTFASAINDSNQIAAEGCRDGSCQGLLLTLQGVGPGPQPVSEPATGGMLLLGLGLLGLARRRERARAQAPAISLFSSLPPSPLHRPQSRPGWPTGEC